MGESIWCNIKVKTPKAWNVLDSGSTDGEVMPPWFVADLYSGRHGGALINGEQDIDEETDEFTIWSTSGEGNYGLTDDQVQAVLGFLQSERIPYIAQEDAKYEWLGSYNFFDCTEVHSTEYAGEECVLPESRFNSMMTLADPLEAMKRYFLVGGADLSGTDISHLPTECPPRPEAE